MATSTLLKLGLFTFSIETAAFNQLQRAWSFTWSEQKRLGTIPQLQYTGEGQQTINLSGSVFPGQYGVVDTVEKMAILGRQGKPLLLVAGTGDLLDYWCITSVEQTNSYLDQQGQPRKINFSLAISYYGEYDAISDQTKR
ncbi:phage tail protein [Zooshikella marina]|uniref:phage tail protein n=1 Tax=Zooshikella ganghwensis TaxID=202772 RepID=UPI001BAF06A7|nr:phage tail protein [Zooshikella ganghwensis]MBU2709313.1 phage tail protein [Zooshikella ganghwensis]